MRWISNTLSLLIAVGYITYYYRSGYLAGGSATDLVIWLIVLTFTLCLIWFGDVIGGLGQQSLEDGDVVPVEGGRYVDQSSPGSIVSLIGWVFLLSPLLIIPLFKLIASK